MIPLNKLRCGACGQRKMVMKSALGRSYPYKSYEAVEIKVDWLYVPVCDSCDNSIIRGWAKDSAALDFAIEISLEMLKKSENDARKTCKNDLSML